jgi:hypothetical protein
MKAINQSILAMEYEEALKNPSFKLSYVEYLESVIWGIRGYKEIAPDYSENKADLN